MTFLHQAPTTKSCILLLIGSFIIRAATMFFFIQPGGYFSQPDSPDYHNCAVSLAHNNSMYHLTTNQPIFWRTPGYPWYLALFYKWFGASTAYHENKFAQKTAIWIQIIISSFIPLLLWYLTFILTHTPILCWIIALIAVIHPGLVLASTYLLTEGISLIFFYLFLCFLFQQLIPQYHSTRGIVSIAFSALFLGIYTWIRPMGEVVAIVSTALLFFGAIGNWKQKIVKSVLFFTLFFASLAPWYIRNHQLTNEWFFNPTSGPYFTCFCAPKVMSHVSGRPLMDCWRECQQLANLAIQKKAFFLRGTGTYVSPLASRDLMVTIIKQSPFWFLIDWTQETVKTTFDLYSYQLVAMMNDTFWYDPLQEFLTEKTAAVLWQEPVPFLIRIIGWVELIFSLFLWIGLFAGAWLFVFKPLIFRYTPPYHLQRVWIIAGILIACIIAPTGGFGYARLRLPAEPLLWILSFTFWFYIKSASRSFKPTGKI